MKGVAAAPAYLIRWKSMNDFDFPPENATVSKFRAELYEAILKYAKRYTQKQLQMILGEPQPRVSELLNGRIAGKSVDKLLYYAGRLGIEAKAKFAQTHKEVVAEELRTGDGAQLTRS
ncbi:MAG: XRE family transcriptional regulator [Candidatus Acidiferrum sp.]|jgi:predicted XRE-type DNA-binding protein